MNDNGFDFPHCGRTGCLCTHTQPCTAGWIDGDDGSAAPCVTCRPDRQPTPEERRNGRRGRAEWLRRLRATNARATRNKADASDW